jgi:Ca2+-binding EF-hand superfamily protein
MDIMEFYDKESTGFLSVDEIKEIVIKGDEALTPFVADEVLDDFRDEKGNVNYEVFIDTLLSSYSSHPAAN